MYFIAKYLAAAGIDLQLYTTTWSHLANKVPGKRPGIIFRYAWHLSISTPKEVLYALFHAQSKFNRGGCYNPDADRLLEKAQDELDESKRIGLYREAETLIIADVPIINLVHHKFERLFHPYVYGANANSLGEHYILMKTIWLDMAQNGFLKTARTQ